MLGLLSSRADRLIWGALAILLAVVLGRALKLIAGRLGERRPSEEHELQQLRTRETAIVLLATAIPYATAIVVLIVLASFFLPVAVLGGSAFLAVVLGFAAQRFLMDIVAGTLIGFERWYAVGDFLMLEPAKASGIVEQFGLRTTVLRSLNGDAGLRAELSDHRGDQEPARLPALQRRVDHERSGAGPACNRGRRPSGAGRRGALSAGAERRRGA